MVSSFHLTGGSENQQKNHSSITLQTLSLFEHCVRILKPFFATIVVFLRHAFRLIEEVGLHGSIFVFVIHVYDVVEEFGGLFHISSVVL